MDTVKELIGRAKEGIVFLTFQLGGSSTMDVIVVRLTGTVRDEQQVHKFRIFQPQGLQGIGKWAAEVSRGQFLNQIGFAIVHSKVSRD